MKTPEGGMPIITPEQSAEREHIFDSGSYSAEREVGGKPNEDALIDDLQHKIFGVFDGLGRHRDGDKVAQIAASATYEHLLKLPSVTTVENTQNAIRDAFLAAHVEIKSFAVRQGVGNRESHPATTATACKIIAAADGGQWAVFGQVGDSSAYLLRANGSFQKLTEMHSLAEKWRSSDPYLDEHYDEVLSRIDNATSDADLQHDVEKRLFSNRSVLTRALGIESAAASSPSAAQVFGGDEIVIISDGVSDNITTDQLRHITGRDVPAPEKARMLVDLAKVISKRPGDFRAKLDDATAVVIKIGGKKREATDVIVAAETMRAFKVGDIVKVKRTSGRVEAGWEIFQIRNDGDFWVKEKVSGAAKLVRAGDMRKYNP